MDYEKSLGIMHSTSTTAALPSEDGLQFQYTDGKDWILDPLIAVRAETANTANAAIGAALERARGGGSSSSGGSGSSGGGEAASADRHRARLRRNLRTRLSGFSRAVGVVVCVGCGGGAPPPPRSLSRSLVCLSDAVGGCNEGAPQTPRRRRLFGRTFTRDAGSWRCWGPPSLYAACAV